jgi:hypothetical protein
VAAAASLVLAFAGPASAADTAKVRVLHASPDAPAVDVYLDDAIVGPLTNVPFGTISGYLDIPAGAHNVKVYAAGTTTGAVIDANVTVATGDKYTIAATNALASIEPQVIEDQPAPSCSTAQVRVVHLSADAPAVDVGTAGSAPADAVVKNLSYPDATGYLALPAATYDLEVRLAGTTTVALALPGVTIADCKSYSVFAVGSAATPAVGANALQVVVAVDATAASAPAQVTAPPTDTLVTSATPTDGSGVLTAVLLVAVLVIALGASIGALGRRSTRT